MNSIALFVNCVDFIYFRFTLKRITADFLSLFSMGDDMKNTIPQMLRDFWYVAFIWFLLVLLMGYLYKKANYYENEGEYGKQRGIKYYLRNSVLFIIISFISIIGARGGFQLKPINIITASLYADANNVPLVLNTPFTIIKTFNKTALEKVKYFKNDDELKSFYNPYHKANIEQQTTNNERPNVVIIIIESFSKELIGALNGLKTANNEPLTYTPFLDSLIHESLVFPNAFANGRRSIEGIPAALAGIPALMTSPFISSAYAGDKFYSLPSLLKEEGYNTSFYHGGSNGTMGFDNFCKAAGIDQYYGRHEYNNDKDYDGNWGIFDEPFLQYFASSLDKTAQPFMASLFTLSSHHPYTIPEQHKNKFNKGNEFQKSVSYTDYALKRFFETASKMKWFDNTLFVITADHTSQIYNKAYDNRLGEYEVPIIYYRHNSYNSKVKTQKSNVSNNSQLPTPNSQLKGFDSTITEQIDIMPSVLDYIHYNKHYFAFGKSIFNQKARTTNNEQLATNFAISYLNNSYQFISADYVIWYDGKAFTSIFDRKADPSLKHNLLNTGSKIPDKRMDEIRHQENCVKAVIQTFNQSMIENKLTSN